MQVNQSSLKIRKLYREVLSELLTKPPSTEMIADYLDTDSFELQEWCIDHSKISWSTGISLIDAAYMIVEEAFGNANIDAEGNIL